MCTRPTSRGFTQLDHIEALPADGATVGPLHPGLQAIVMEDMATGQQMGDLAGILFTIPGFPGGTVLGFGIDGDVAAIIIIIIVRSWHSLGDGRRAGASAKVS